MQMSFSLDPALMYFSEGPSMIAFASEETKRVFYKWLFAFHFIQKYIEAENKEMDRKCQMYLDLGGGGVNNSLIPQVNLTKTCS